MAIYSVHLPKSAPGEREAAEAARFVKDGFAWWGLVFGPIWLLAHRLWLAALGIIGLEIGVGVLTASLNLPAPTALLLSALPALLVGFEGPGWRRWSLERRGYREAGVVAGADRHEIERRFFAAHLDSLGQASHARRIAPTARSTESEGGVLGLFPQASRP